MDVSMLINLMVRDNTAGGINSASSRMDKFKARTTVAAAGILGAAGAIGARSVAIASDTAESASKVTTLFGKSAKSVHDFSATSAKSYGMSKVEALGAVGSMGAVQIAMGTNAKAAAKTSVEYVKLSADLASFNNASSAEVQEALTGALSGEYEMLKKYGIVVNDTTLAAEAQRIGMKKTGDTWTSAQKQQLSYNIIMESTKVAQGDFARTQDGAANQTKILQARMSDLQGAIGAKLLPVVIKVLGWFNKVGTWMQENQTTTKVLAGILGGLAGAIVAVSIGMKIITGVIKLKAAAWRMLATAMWANPVFLIAGIIIGIGVALVIAYKKCDWFRNVVNKVFGGIKNFITSAWDGIKYRVNAAIKVIGGAYLTFADGVLGVFEGLLRGASKLPKWLGGGKFDGAADAVAGIRRGIQSMKDKLDELPTSKKMDIALQTEKAASKLRALKTQLEGIKGVHNATVNVQTRVAVAESGGFRSTVGGNTRAGGGPVTRGRTYLVGEEGPEMVTMGGSGFVTPNNMARKLGGGPGGVGGGGGAIALTINLFDEDGSLKRKIRKMVRVDGGGSVQAAFGVKGS